MDKAVKYYQMAAEHGVNMAIDALIRLGLYSETRDLAIYPRSVDNYSCYDSLDELHLDGTTDGETF
jgi:TPR repeat protein